MRGAHYNQSASLWTKKFNRLLMPYEGSLQLLKSLFFASWFEQGLKVNKNHLWPWDSKEDLSSKNKEDGQKDIVDFNEERISFSFENFSKKNCYQISSYPDYEKYAPYLREWRNLCENRFQKLDTIQLTYETALLLKAFLDALPISEDTDDFDLRPYISNRLSEMFSSDPKRAIQTLSAKEKIQLAKALITAGWILKTACLILIPILFKNGR